MFKSCKIYGILLNFYVFKKVVKYLVKMQLVFEYFDETSEANPHPSCLKAPENKRNNYNIENLFSFSEMKTKSHF